MMVAVLNNLSELILGAAWTAGTFYFGARFGRWRTLRKDN